jgi:hypothetical protein
MEVFVLPGFWEANYNAAAYAMLSINIVLTIAAVTGKTLSQRLIKASLAVDDYLCCFASVSPLFYLPLYIANQQALQLRTPHIRSDLDHHRIIRFRSLHLSN